VSGLNPVAAAPDAHRVRPSPPRRNAAVNAAGFLTRIVIAFVMAPTLLTHLGDARYGTWLLINQLTGYYGLLDIGVRAAVAYYVARLQAKNEWAELEEVVRACFWLLSALGLVVTAVGIGISLAIPSLFRLESISPDEAVTASLIVCVMVGLNLPMSVPAAILNGVRRIDLAAGDELVVRTLSAFVIIGAVRSGAGLVTVAAINAAATAVIWGLTWWQVRAIGAGTSLWPPKLDIPRLRDAFRLGSANFFVNITLLLINNVQVVLIGAVLGAALIAPFSLGNQIVSNYHMLVATITMTFTTAFTHLHASEQKDQLRSFFCDSSRYTGALATVAAAGLFVYGAAFLRLWVGEKYITGDWRYRADVVLALLLIATLPRTFQNTSFQLLMGIRHLRFLTILRGVEAAANLALTLALIRPLGLAGVAIGMLVPMFISHAGWMAAHTLGVLDLSWGDYWRRVLRGPVLLGCWAAVCAVAASWLLPPHNWLNLAAGALLTVTLAFPVFLKTVAAPEHVRAAVARLNKLLGRNRANAF
jgi:O-antigen/teichoic acid export membrane protein